MEHAGEGVGSDKPSLLGTAVYMKSSIFISHHRVTADLNLSLHAAH